MPVVASAADFLAVARKSSQLDAARLEAFLASRKEIPGDPRKLAAMLVREGLITAFQAEQFLLGKYKGFHIGGYRVTDRLGSGGAGTVYLAEHSLMKRRAAVKVLPTSLAEDPSIVERFRIEAQAAAALDHPNVVHLYDFSKEGRLYYLVMEYIDGPNLQQLLSRRGPLDIALACEYARQAAQGLGHAHQASMVHRDVKPANILIDSTGTIKVLDLGLARLEQEDGESVTRKFNSGAVLGTADYLAPEQAMDLHDVDHRADIYGLGGTLYALLTGKPPFPGGTIGQKLMWHQTKDPEPVDKVRPQVPPDLAAVVARMLKKKPEDRQQSMDEVIEWLSPWADQAPPPQGRPSPRSLAEIRIGGPPTNRLMPGASGRLPGKPSADTWVNGQVDTGRMEPESPPAPAESATPAPAASPAGRMGKKLLVGALLAVLGGVAGGIAALLMMGLRP